MEEKRIYTADELTAMYAENCKRWEAERMEQEAKEKAEREAERAEREAERKKRKEERRDEKGH